MDSHPYEWGRRGQCGVAGAAAPSGWWRTVCWCLPGCEACSCWTSVNKKKGMICGSWGKRHIFSLVINKVWLYFQVLNNWVVFLLWTYGLCKSCCVCCLYESSRGCGTSSTSSKLSLIFISSSKFSRPRTFTQITCVYIYIYITTGFQHHIYMFLQEYNKHLLLHASSSLSLGLDFECSADSV